MPERREEILENSMIIVAHPDDENLWFSSVLRDVDQVLVAYHDFWAQPELGEARRKALASYPHPNIETLGLPDPGTFGKADFHNPAANEAGLELNRRPFMRNAKSIIRGLIAPVLRLPREPSIGVDGLYEKNAEELYEALKPRLSADMNVFTHNPWGEYGHECHVQVYRVVARLQQEIGFRMWVSNYCSNRSVKLWFHCSDEKPYDSITLETDREYAEEIRDIYIKYGCWTWEDDWQWFETETFFEPDTSNWRHNPQNGRLPLNMFRIAGSSGLAAAPAIGGGIVALLGLDPAPVTGLGEVLLFPERS